MPFIRWKEEKNERIPESDTRDCGNRLFSADPALCKKEDAFPEIHAALVVFRVCDGDAGAVPRPAGCLCQGRRDETPMYGLFVFAIFFILVIAMSLTAIVSKQTERIKNLAQENAALEKRVRELEMNKGAGVDIITEK